MNPPHDDRLLPPELEDRIKRAAKTEEPERSRMLAELPGAYPEFSEEIRVLIALQGLMEPGASTRIEESAPPAELLESHSRYRLDEEFARGGMGVLYGGRDLGLERQVALKLLRADRQPGADAADRFLEEAQIGAQLQHPGVVPVYDSGHLSDGRPFIAMKLVEGETLRDLLNRRDSPDQDLRRVLDVFHSVCQTVAYAHARGVIHRDLKPSNVLVGRFGEVYVLDWGLAKVLGAAGSEQPPGSSAPGRGLRTVRTASGTSGSYSLDGDVVGTPGYMAPEQARGEVARLDARADVFALGGILCTILTGRPTWRGDTVVRVADAQQGKVEAALAAVRSSSAEPELIELVTACLAPRAEDRPADAEEVARRVGHHLDSVEQRAQRARLESVAARERARAALVLAVVVLCVVVGGAWVWASWNEAVERRRTATARATRAELMTAERAAARSDWSTARTAVDRAGLLLNGEDVPAGLPAEVASTRARVAAGASAAEAEERLAAGNRALSRAWEDAPRPLHTPGEPAARARLLRAFRDGMASAGLDPFVPEEGEALAALSSRGIDEELAAMLLEWFVWLEPVGSAEELGRLASLADALDPQSRGRTIRTAIQTGERSALEGLTRERELLGEAVVIRRMLALAFFELREPRRAIEILRETAAQHPQQFAVLMDLGSMLFYERRDDAEEAAQVFRAAVALRPDSIEARFRYGFVLGSGLRDPDAARAVLDDAVRRWPGHAGAKAWLAWALREQGQVDEALRWNRRAAAEDPDDGWVQQELAMSLFAVRDFAGSREAVDRALELQPGLPFALIVRANLLRLEGEHEAAVEVYREVLDVQPESFAASYGLGDALVALRRHGEAIEAFEAAERGQTAQLEPDNRQGQARLERIQRRLIDTRCTRAQLALQRGDTATALEDYRAVLAIDDTLADPWLGLGVVHEQLGDIDAAIDAYLRVLGEASVAPAVVRKLMTLLASTGRRADELRTLRRLIELADDDPAPRIRLAELLSTAAEPELVGVGEGLRAARRAVELRPDSRQAQRALGMASYRCGLLEESITALEGVADPESRGDDPLACYFLAMAHRRLGRSQAGAWLARAGAASRGAADPAILRIADEARRLLER